MNSGTYPLAASMINQINRLDMISNNLANANTNGFKQEGSTEGSFNYYLQRAEKEGFEPTKLSTVMNTIPKMDANYISGEKGPLLPTGNPLDFALTKNDTFFQVQDNNGNTTYSRDGAFKIQDDMLVDGNGNFVLSNDGEPIVTTEENFQAQISVVQISYNDLNKQGDNKYNTKPGAIITPFAVNDNELMQGSIEKSNVNSVTAMVELIDAHRRLEQSQKAIEGIGQINEKLIDKIGHNTK